MYTKFFKRVIDIVLSELGLIILAVPMAIVAIIIGFPGPVIFKQKRGGIHKKHFRYINSDQ